MILLSVMARFSPVIIMKHMGNDPDWIFYRHDGPIEADVFEGELDTDVNENPFISRNSSENYMSYFEAGTEFAVGVEP